MFCDMVGSTAISRRLDPEELRELFAAYQSTCAQVVGRFDGHIARRMGDGLLIYFGYPQAHEDDAARAVRAGLDLLGGIRELDARFAHLGVSVAVRIGINTGIVVAGDIGSGDHKEEMGIVGEAPNIAAHLQAIGEPGTVVIGESTYRLVEGLFNCENLGPQQLKGIAEPMVAYRVHHGSGAPTQFEARAQRGLTPLVGRSEEIGILLRRWQRVRDGEGHVVLLSGESGIGKSRILRSFQQAVDQEVRWRFHYYCSPYHLNSPFYPVISQIERALSFAPADTPERKVTRLDGVLRDLDLPAADFTPLLATLLSLPMHPTCPPPEISPEVAKRKTLDALVSIIEMMAARAPAMVVVEDMHWIDPSTMELLNLLVERLRSGSFLLIAAFRTGFHPPWERFPHITRLSLDRLSRRETAEIVSQVVANRMMPRDLFEHIVTKTDGVPLFVEELTKSVLESHATATSEPNARRSSELAIPASLQDSLMARLDRLGPVKEIAQIAATLGRTFGYDLLSAVSNLSEGDLRAALTQLIDAELIYPRGPEQGELFEFKHALVQDVAYDSMLRSKRQQLHRRIALVLEERFPQKAEADPAMLAHHCGKAGLAERAIPYALRAGDEAAKRYAPVEARARYQQALEFARSLPPSEQAARHHIRAVLKLANVAVTREHFESDLENLEQVKALAEQFDRQPRLAQIHYWIGRTNYVLGRLDRAREYAENALKIAEAVNGDERLASGPLNLLARIHCLGGELHDGIDFASRSLRQMHAFGNRVEEASMAGVLAFGFGKEGSFEKAFEAADRGVTVAERTEHLPTMAAGYFFRAVVRGWFGDLQTAVGDFDRAVTIATKSGDTFRRYVAHGWCGEAYLLAERIDEAEKELEHCLALGDEIGTSYHRGAYQAFLGKVHLLRGNIETARRVAESAVRIATETSQPWSRSIALRVCGEVLLGLDPPNLQRAETTILSAVLLQEQLGCRYDLAWSRLVWGNVLAAKGEFEAASAAFADVDAMFLAMGMEVGRQRTRAALDRLPPENGSKTAPGRTRVKGASPRMKVARSRV